MRWKPKKANNYPRLGDTKVVRKFLIFPKTLEVNSESETRWLCMAWINVKYSTTHFKTVRNNYWWHELHWGEKPMPKRRPPLWFVPILDFWLKRPKCPHCADTGYYQNGLHEGEQCELCKSD